MNSFWKYRRLVAICGLVGFYFFSISPVASGADSGGREDRPDRVADTRAEDPTLASLINVQNSIRNVVDRNLPAVISISDGAGFGSGVIVSPEGLILTAGHVVNTGASQFEIFFPGGQTATARLLGYNLNVDAAMLKLDGTGPWPFVELGEQASLKKGDWVVCLGHSGGYELGRKPPVRTGRVLDFRDEMVVTDAVLIGGD
jgi:serine protease Do